MPDSPVVDLELTSSSDKGAHPHTDMEVNPCGDPALEPEDAPRAVSQDQLVIEDEMVLGISSPIRDLARVLGRQMLLRDWFSGFMFSDASFIHAIVSQHARDVGSPSSVRRGIHNKEREFLISIPKVEGLVGNSSRIEASTGDAVGFVAEATSVMMADFAPVGAPVEAPANVEDADIAIEVVGSDATKFGQNSGVGEPLVEQHTPATELIREQADMELDGLFEATRLLMMLCGCQRALGETTELSPLEVATLYKLKERYDVEVTIIYAAEAWMAELATQMTTCERAQEEHPMTLEEFDTNLHSLESRLQSIKEDLKRMERATT
ncbi:hypothetical protein ACLOJK_026956 [Asimina triloba]